MNNQNVTFHREINLKNKVFIIEVKGMKGFTESFLLINKSNHNLIRPNVNSLAPNHSHLSLHLEISAISPALKLTMEDYSREPFTVT